MSQDSIQVRTLLRYYFFGPGHYSSQDSIQSRLQFESLRYVYFIFSKKKQCSLFNVHLCRKVLFEKVFVYSKHQRVVRKLGIFRPKRKALCEKPQPRLKNCTWCSNSSSLQILLESSKSKKQYNICNFNNVH